MPRQKARAKYAIICDDVRREENGKLFLIGVYSNNILVPHFPTNLGLSVVVAVETDGPEQFEIELRLKIDQKTIRQAHGSVTISASGVTLIPVTGLARADSVGPGTLSIQAKVDQHRWETVCSVILDQKPN